MPNLTSVSKIKKLFKSENKELVYVFVSYKIEDGFVRIKKIQVFFIWELDFSILGIGALGKGQLQIKDANKDLVFTELGKENWFKNLKVQVCHFLKKQEIKIKKQILEWK